MARAEAENPEPVTPTRRDSRAARLAVEFLSGQNSSNRAAPLRIGRSANSGAFLPGAAVRILFDALGHMAEGKAVAVLPLQEELTTHQAADLLNVSRPYLIGLLAAGALPHRMVGTHRRIRRDDVLAYRRRAAARRSKILDELAAHDRALGLE